MKTRMDTLLAEIADQITWIEQHGGNADGYVRRYGAANDPERYGDGGEAIYAADKDALDNLLHHGSRYPQLTLRSAR